MSDNYTPEPDKYRKNSPNGPGQEYTPTEAEARQNYVEQEGVLSQAEFDRWLAAHDAKVRADARAKRPDRNDVRRAVGGVLFDVMNFPEKAHTSLLGQNLGPLNEKITNAVLALEPEAREVTDAAVVRALVAYGYSENDLRFDPGVRMRAALEAAAAVNDG